MVPEKKPADAPPPKPQFFRVLLPGSDFTTKLCIPSKFMKHFKEKISEVLELKDLSNLTWKVKLIKVNGDSYLGDGWNVFLKGHCLEETDVLFFEYEGHSCFSVKMFDKSGCEKISSYFIKDKHSCFFIGNECRSSGVPSMEAEGEQQQFVHLETSLDEEDGMERNSNSSDGTESHDEREDVEINTHRQLTYQTCLISNRRLVTDAEKKWVLREAKQFRPSSPFFLTVMKPSHVYKGHFMTVPRKFAQKYLPRTNQTAILCLPHGTKEWHVSYRHQRCSSGFSGQWEKFVRDNNLEEGDACVFELKGTPRRQFLMHVNIFRVVKEVEQLTRVSLGKLRKKPTKMEGRCKCCMEWVEYIYWNHFETNRVHFFKVLVPGFQEQTGIPKKFLLKFRERLSQTVELKGPSEEIWPVRLKEDNGDVYFGEGWGNFVKAHSLDVNTFLVFKYEGSSVFRVTVMDISGCERDSSSCFPNNRKKKRRESSIEILSLPSPEIHNCSSSSDMPDMDIKEEPR